MTDTQRTFRLGGDIEIERLGYGAMRLTGQPGNFGPYPDWEGGKSLLRETAALGVGLIDTARAYGPGWNERLIAEAFEGRPRPVIATKGGVDKRSPTEIVVDGRPETLARQVDEALVNLRLERIDLFQLHRVDPAVAIEESVGALAEVQAAGKIAHIGLSNVTRDQLDRARAAAPIASVQNRYNPAETGEGALVDHTAALGIAFIPYGPLGAHPMRPGAALPAQAALAWLLRRAPNIIVIPGTTSIAHLRENAAAWTFV